MMEDFFTTAQAAAISGLKPVSIRMAICRGTLPASKAGRDWLITRADLEAFVKADRKRGPKAKT
ncbi:MAG: helix-turn-helix domain-containing protein [Deltaproteobacteria bacterium]|jgi:excisionase family DNA binding protein|nr:helix-turn-helix domain-containing protein [Deltaproteobacteria bacterium]